jgi:hypothetical protein
MDVAGFVQGGAAMDRWRMEMYGLTPGEMAAKHFGGAQLGNCARTRRLVSVAEAMISRPGSSLTQQCPGEAQQAGAYRFFSNPWVEPAAIVTPHLKQVREFCREQQGVTLCVQDTMELSYPTHRAKRGLGKISGPGTGILQHSALALSEEGELHGVLDVRWSNRRPLGRTKIDRKGRRRTTESTRQQQQASGKESELWSCAAQAIGRVESGWGRLVQIADRGADIFAFLACCRDLGHGFVVRAQHDRYLEDSQGERLWQRLQKQPLAFMMEVQVRASRGSGARTARVAVRYAAVLLPPPRNAPHLSQLAPIVGHALLVQEMDAPKGEEAVQWMLLSSEAIIDEASARRILRWYGYRWRIEEWHRVLKEGLGLEKSRLDDAADIRRLAAVLCVQATQLMVLRELADQQRVVAEHATVRRLLPPSYLQVVAALAGQPMRSLTGKEFWRQVALRGGWPGKARSPRPGWIVIWRGWREIVLIADAMAKIHSQNL